MRILKRIQAKGLESGRWLRANRLRVTASVLVVAAVSSGGALAWYQRTVIADVVYQPCEISYGEVVGEWSGGGEATWDQAGMHYQVRRFRLGAHAPDTFFPNTIEAEPTRISTGGDNACEDDFDERIDTDAEMYRYNGARASAVRLGVPDLGERNGHGRFFPDVPRAVTNTELATPVYGSNGTAAAAWVDDGGSARISVDDEDAALWCINDLDCDDIVNQSGGEEVQRGHGYQFVDDNCPDAADCESEWYDPDSFAATIDGQDTAVVTPFDLRLSAVSTWAPSIGAEMILVFAYPTEVELELASTTEGERFDPGDEFAIELSLAKHGPEVGSVQIDVTADDQPVTVTPATASFDEDELAAFNRRDRSNYSLAATLSSNAERDACYELTFTATVTYGDDQSEATTTNLRYCTSPPPPPPPRPVTAAAATYTYSIHTRGSTTSNIGEFRTQAAQTLADSRGWTQASVAFREVDSGGDFILWLAAPDQMTSFSQQCSAEYSCRVGKNVIINDTRWQNATDAWNSAGGSLRDYRHMVINHEVGHFLGHGHYGCPGSGALAPVMQQQSIDLAGCRFNPWPLPFEIAST